jgi:poly(A) polymerase
MTTPAQRATVAEAIRTLALLARERTDLPPAYLVGGAVRDALLRRPVTELDIATAAPEVWATTLAAALSTHVVQLGDRFPLQRLPLENGSIDLTQLAGTLDEDLARRDFTVNALAVPLERVPADLAQLDPSEVIDQHDGLADLDARHLRLISEHALVEDPLRTLRAVRLAAELAFTIDPATEAAITTHAALLADIAPERVEHELTRLFASPRASQGIRLLERTTLLDICFPELIEGRAVDQRPHHRLDVLDHALAASEWIDILLALEPPADEPAATIWHTTWDQPWPASRWGDVRHHLNEHATTLRIATLLHDVGKPRTRTVEPDGRTRFFGHGDLGADIVRSRLAAWRFPSRQIERIALLLEQHLRPGQIASPGEPPTPRALHRFHDRLGDATPDVCLLFLADSLATADPRELATRWPAYVAHVQRITCWRPPPAAAEVSALVDGNAVIAATGLPPGPEIGRILAVIAEAAASEEIRDADEALALARQLANESLT